MTNEFTIKSGLTLSNGSLTHQTYTNSFQCDQTTKNGPTPGAISVTTSGVTVSLSQLTTPGIVVMRNLDATNYVRWGLYISSTFYPCGKIKPGEQYVFRLASDILTANSGAAVLRMVANSATCIVKVEAFDD